MITTLIIGIVCFIAGFTGAYLIWRKTTEKQRREIRRFRAGLPPKEKQPMETTKKVIWLCLAMGFLWVCCSYVLAWLDKVQIAESLSQVAVTEIIGVVLAYCIKSAVENLSKNNHWPDKPPSAEPEEPKADDEPVG